MTNITRNIDAVKIDESIRLLNEYVKETSISPLITALEALKKDPDSKSLLTQLCNTFNDLDVVQGAVLTYAPYVAILMSDNLFRDK